MLEFLKGKSNHFIGVDFGTSSIKAVELSYKDQKVFLENYGIVDLNFLAGSDFNKQKEIGKVSSYEQNLAEGVRRLFEKMKPKAKSRPARYANMILKVSSVPQAISVLTPRSAANSTSSGIPRIEVTRTISPEIRNCVKSP